MGGDEGGKESVSSRNTPTSHSPSPCLPACPPAAQMDATAQVRHAPPPPPLLLLLLLLRGRSS